jgi:hypothetical protein
MSLKSKLKTGGGFLNDVNAVIEDVNFVTGETAKIKNGKNKGKPFTPVSLVVDFLPEGAESQTPQRLLIGGAESMEYDISEDGKTITFESGGIYANSEAGVFLSSCVAPENGKIQFPDDEFGTDDNEVSVAVLVGGRVRLVRPVNRVRKPQIDKDGKSWPAKDLKVSEIFELGGGKKAKGGKPAVKGKAAKAEPEEEEIDPSEAATQALLRYLENAKDNTLQVSKLKMKATTDPEFSKDKDLRTAVIALLEDADFLKGVDEIEYNGKKGIVSLPDGD